MNLNYIFNYYYQPTNKSHTNQDAILIKGSVFTNCTVLIALICDGMGGMEQGDYASMLCFQHVEQWYNQELLLFIEQNYLKLSKKAFDINIKSFGQRLFQKINFELFQYMRLQNMNVGTTASLLILINNQYYIFHIGDCRIYKGQKIIKSNFLKQITVDHSCNQKLTRCLGLNKNGTPDFIKGKLFKTSYFLLATDGFYRGIKKDNLINTTTKMQTNDQKKIYRILESIACYKKSMKERDDMSAIYIGVRKEQKCQRT